MTSTNAPSAPGIADAQAGLIARLHAVVGDAGLITDSEAQQPYVND